MTYIKIFNNNLKFILNFYSKYYAWNLLIKYGYITSAIKKIIWNYNYFDCRKKLSTFCHNQNWRTASNYVAKRYMEDVDKSVYFEDVKLQIDAKLWAEEYNRHNPPKKVHFFSNFFKNKIKWLNWVKTVL